MGCCDRRNGSSSHLYLDGNRTFLKMILPKRAMPRNCSRSAERSSNAFSHMRGPLRSLPRRPGRLFLVLASGQSPVFLFKWFFGHLSGHLVGRCKIGQLTLTQRPRLPDRLSDVACLPKDISPSVRGLSDKEVVLRRPWAGQVRFCWVTSERRANHQNNSRVRWKLSSPGFALNQGLPV